MPGTGRWKALLQLIPAAAFLLLALNPHPASEAALSAVTLCLRTVIPALFPFLVLTRLLLGASMPGAVLRIPGMLFERLFHIRAAAFPAFLLGLLGGYPLGAEAAAAAFRRGDCSAEEASRLLVFANNCGPGFLFGASAAILPRGRSDALLLLCLQWAVSLWLGMLLGIGRRASASSGAAAAEASLPAAGLFTASVLAGGRAVLIICAYVVFFSTLSAFLPPIPLLKGCFEMTGGLLALKGGDPLLPAAFLIGWGGLAVACQVLSAVSDTEIPAGKYIPLRFLHGCCMLLAAWSVRRGSFWLLLPPVLAAAVAFIVKRCRKAAISAV